MVNDIYIVDGSNIFFEGTPAETAEQCSAIQDMIFKTGGARKRVIVVVKQQTNIRQPRFLEYLSHLVSEENPVVDIVQVDMHQCDPNNRFDSNCVEKNRGICTYRHDRQQLTRVPPPYNTTLNYEEVTESLSGHLFCEYDDIILSCLFWAIESPNVEVISRDRRVIKSPNLMTISLAEMKEMHTNYGNKMYAPVNLITDCYTMHVSPSTDQKRQDFATACNAANAAALTKTPQKRSATTPSNSNKSSRSSASSSHKFYTPKS